MTDSFTKLFNDAYPDAGKCGYVVHPEVQDILMSGVSKLERNRCAVLTLYYGLGCPSKTCSEIASQLNLPKTRVQSLRKRALADLRYPKYSRQVLAASRVGCNNGR